MSETFVESLRRNVEAARVAMRAGQHRRAEKLASDGLKDLFAQTEFYDFPKLVETAIKLYCLRGSSRCMLGNKLGKERYLYDAKSDFEDAITFARNYLSRAQALQCIADAQLNLAIAMLFNRNEPHGATIQLEQATKLLNQCADPFAHGVNQLVKASPQRQLAHLRW